jgi:Tol biopolymer transport system component
MGRQWLEAHSLDGYTGLRSLAPDMVPDGERIAFTSEDKKGAEIYVMNSDGSGLTKLTDDPAYDAFPAWRP